MINVYRCFNTQDDPEVRQKFCYQLGLINTNNNTIILEDFNLNYRKIEDVSYAHKNLFNDYEVHLDDFNQIQLVELETWSRVVMNKLMIPILLYFI